MKSLLIIVSLLLLIILEPLSIITYADLSDPLPIGISTFFLTPTIITNFVIGVANITSISIGKSYLGLEVYQEGNASLQLNAVLDNQFWIQNVALFQQGKDSLRITFIVNIWNLSGKFYINDKNITSYRGLGVLIYVGPTINVSLPLSLTLFIKSNMTSTSFGYKINNDKERIYYIFQIGGSIIIGGFSNGIGIPNSLELVWGGPGEGSSVYMNVNSTMGIYYLDEGTNSLKIPPVAYSFGFDTGEGVYNLNTVRSGEIFSPYALTISAVPSRNILWPTPPQISLKKINDTLYVSLTLDGKPIPNQKIIVKNVFFQDIGYGITNSSGIARIDNISSLTYIVYYPGNFTISNSYVFSSELLQRIYGYLKDEYNSISNFISNLNLSKHIISIFSKVSNQQQSMNFQYENNFNLTIIIIILSFLIGFLIAAILSRKL
ncbi:MAG: thermopsin family protease [Sulfolobaceae archaeon]